MAGSVNIEYLIDSLRLRIGDTDPDTYRYMDEWLKKALIVSTKTLGRYWNYKYMVTDSGVVTRNVNSTQFIFPEDYGVIQDADEPIIIIMACIILLEGSFENSSWSISSWRDNEISMSNLEQGRMRDTNIKRFWDELKDLISVPAKKLAFTTKRSLPGYLNNEHEQGSN